MTPQQYIIQLSLRRKVLSLKEFFKLLHVQYYSDVDLSFMDTFLTMTKYENRFLVPFEKLQEYSVDKSLVELDLVEDQDYELIDICESKNVYYLTPDAFKRCVLKYSKDASVYIDYYLLLEKVHCFYEYYNKLINK